MASKDLAVMPKEKKKRKQAQKPMAGGFMAELHKEMAPKTVTSNPAKAKTKKKTKKAAKGY